MEIQIQQFRNPKTIVDYHPHEKIIGSLDGEIENWRSFIYEWNMSMISHSKPKSFDDVIIDESWIKTMKEELFKFGKNQVWNLVLIFIVKPSS